MLMIAMTTLLLPASSTPTVVIFLTDDWADCHHDAYAYAGGPDPYAEMEHPRSSGGGSNTEWVSGTGWAKAASGSGATCSTQ